MTTRNRIPWGDCMIVVLAVMILEPLPILALISTGWWLAPPFFYYTPFIYLGLMLAWIPVLFGCILLRPKGSWGVPVVGTGLGLIQVCTILLMLSPLLGHYLVVGNNHKLVISRVSCSDQTVSKGEKIYTCTTEPKDHSSSEVFFLEGSAYSPFVKINR